MEMPTNCASMALKLVVSVSMAMACSLSNAACKRCNRFCKASAVRMVWYWRSTSLPNWCAIFGAAVGAGAALATGAVAAGANKSSVVPLLTCCSASANQRLKPNSAKRVTKSAHAGILGLKSAK